MRRTITGKIISSNLIIIFLTLTIVGAVFSLSVKRFMERQALASLLKDAKSIAEIFKKDQNENQATEKNIRQLLQDRLKNRQELGNIESEWAVVGKGENVIYPLARLESGKIENEVLPQLKRNLLKKKPSNARININQNEYMAVILPVKDAAQQKIKGWVVLYAPVGPVRQLTNSLYVVLMVSLVFTGVVAVVFGVLFAKSIARPIVLLKKRAESLSKRDFDSKVEIRTGDELEELADTINKMAEELKEYNMAQKKFLQNASHELKTPLMSIQGYAEGIKDGVFEDNHKALDIIIEESTRLKELVEELIFLSKLETMEDFYKFETRKLNEVITKSIEKINSLAVKNNISINAAAIEDDILVKMDYDKLIQAFINILANCLRYAKHQVTIKTEIRDAFIDIVVNDDGDGFEQGEIPNVFKRFYKGKKGNTGLGLPITKAVIEKHNGSIEASNGDNGGAEFVVRLPVGRVINTDNY